MLLNTNTALYVYTCTYYMHGRNLYERQTQT